MNHSITYNHSDVENNNFTHGISAAIAAGDSTIATRDGIGLMPRRKSGSGGIHSRIGNNALQPSQQHQHALPAQHPPKAISIKSPPQSPDSRSEASRNNYSYGHGEDGVSSSSSTITFLHHQYQQRESAPPVGADPSSSTATTTTATINTTTTPKSKQQQKKQQQQQQAKVALDLKRNDNAFYVIASLIVDRLNEKLKGGSGSDSAGVNTTRTKTHNDRIILSATDREHLDRVVPRKYDFIHALQWRLATNNMQEHSMQPIHVITRQCRALGLHREGNQNPLLASIGSLILFNSDEATVATNLASIQSARPRGADELARQQLLAELREASTLMAESVTPEASQFWRNHVIELQAKLRALQKASAGEPPSPVNKNHEDAAHIMKRNDQLLASLWQNTGYVPPSQDEMTAVSNSVTAESRAPSIAQNNVNAADPRDMELPMVDVVSPADLPAGYQFEAAIDNNIFIATVPMGGVKKGQTFSCYMKDVKEAGIPYGHWKDGFFNIFKYGAIHPMSLNSIFCPLLALAQVMARLGLDYTGQPVHREVRRRGGWSNKGMMTSVIVFWLGLNSMILFGFELKLHNFVYLSAADILSLVLVNATFALFTIYATVNTRTFLQEKYQIDRQNTPEQLRKENILLSVFCLPFTIAQMGRHTASYDQYDGVCCNETGIPKADIESDEGGIV